MPPSIQPYHKFYRQEMRQFLPLNYSKVLEVGCGEGNFRSNLNNSHEYWGIEPNLAASEIAQEKLDKVLCGKYEDVSNQLPDKYFDLIICNDVIEHMEHHDKFLFALQKNIAPSGSLIVSIPNVRYIPNLMELIFLKDWHYREAGILDVTHLRFFTFKSLKRVLHETGWHINKIRGINRYGSHRIGHKLALSYFGQALFGRDTAYMQFGANLSLKN
ncbi:MAG: class I SAM-dependent methyltransferase [Acidiferrobacterales bacterium]|nr:class I SAM-dependent methyltransferase [Acidiferrobacterales bacterium]